MDTKDALREAPRAVDHALDPDRLVSPAALAERYSCTRQTIYKMLGEGMPSLKLGTARRIRISDADAWLAAQQHSSAA